jgi:hypothetical protein
MHLANASGPDPPAPGAAEPDFVAPAPVGVLDPAVVAESLAALDADVVGLPELPPHPASRSPIARIAGASRRARGVGVSRFGWMLACI